MSNPLDLGQIHHYAYVVDELSAAARRLHAQFGAGPFFYIEQVPVTDVTSRGEPAEFVHGAAFGMCNQVPVELMQVTRIAPEPAGRRFARDGASPRLQHVAYVVPRTAVGAVRADRAAAWSGGHLAHPAALPGRQLSVAGQPSADDQPAADEVDVAPVERHELAAANAGVRSNADELGVGGVLAGPGFDSARARRRRPGDLRTSRA